MKHKLRRHSGLTPIRKKFVKGSSKTALVQDPSFNSRIFKSTHVLPEFGSQPANLTDTTLNPAAQLLTRVFLHVHFVIARQISSCRCRGNKNLDAPRTDRWRKHTSLTV